MGVLFVGHTVYIYKERERKREKYIYIGRAFKDELKVMDEAYGNVRDAT